MAGTADIILHEFKVEMDGSCLFTAMYKAATEDYDAGPEVIRSLREEIADIIYRDIDDSFLIGETRSISREEYCNEVRYSRNWGGEVEMTALSDFLKVSIIVVDEEGTCLKRGRQHYEDMVVLIYCNRNHYNFLYWSYMDGRMHSRLNRFYPNKLFVTKKIEDFIKCLRRLPRRTMVTRSEKKMSPRIHELRQHYIRSGVKDGSLYLEMLIEDTISREREKISRYLC